MDSIDCPFCSAADDEVVLGGDGWYAKFDRYPVSPGHLLLIPHRHIATFFEATLEEHVRLLSLIKEGRRYLDDRFHPDGYNIGINCGPAAGQTIMHLHVHLIPRYNGDMPDPRGGVRGVIPEKRMYGRDSQQCL